VLDTRDWAQLARESLLHSAPGCLAEIRGQRDAALDLDLPAGSVGTEAHEDFQRFLEGHADTNFLKLRSRNTHCENFAVDEDAITIENDQVYVLQSVFSNPRRERFRGDDRLSQAVHSRLTCI